ncbi:hypothetical protein [Silvibacterium dinghuense]|uniref:Nucleotidyl transferase AbiEii/AbiGii toxin family protein n=1 Tax=Silvibacterium dinghuense TaxID=1560006 RepID=A0A4Q1SL14_9BACT|nr:hypothetical protein [Silvibacterium dinghuense]RXS97990.1 hypothetical protein ESZ00_09125 [Silvibacterium dinghuense]GGH03620.1 hypothetical protein GCM10011586_19500 [Silvibacterium dinghuense]
MPTRDPNLALLEEAAEKLAPFLNEIVFVGGVTLGILISDPASAPIRNTSDVDVIAEIVTYADYIEFSERLREQGFSEDMGEGAPTCRWKSGALTLDVLAIREEVLGYTNIWYESALNNPMPIELSSGRSVQIIKAPFFLGTKMEAFRGRGQSDFAASHDLEDFIAVIEGRDELLAEIEECPTDLRGYLAQAAQSLLGESLFKDVLPGFVLDDGRVPLILDRLAKIAQTGSQ